MLNSNVGSTSSGRQIPVLSPLWSDVETAAEMARYSRSHGGFFDERDFTAQRAEWGEPLHATYRGVTIYETPPPSQGVSVLQMLGLVEPWDLGRLEYLGPDHIHLLVQAKDASGAWGPVTAIFLTIA